MRAHLIAARAWAGRHWVEVAMVSPLIAYVITLTVAPILDTLRLAFTAPGDGGFPSLVNYRATLASAIFRAAVWNTVIVAMLSLLLELAAGMGVALALHSRFRFRAVVRTIMLVPLGVPTIVSGAVMLLVFSRSGFLNSALFDVAGAVSKVPGIEWHFVPLSWTVAGGWRTLLTVAVADTWKVLPVVVLIFLAGLQSIPEELYEAAATDGATSWQRFRGITLPLLMPYVTMAVILRAIDALRIFELALVLAGRVAPVLGTFIWWRYAPPTGDIPGAAAASSVLFLFILAFIVLYLRLVAARREILL